MAKVKEKLRMYGTFRHILVGSFLVGVMLVCVLSTQFLFAGQDVVYLRTTVPVLPSAVDIEPSPKTMDLKQLQERRLIESLLNKDENTAYEKLPKKQPWHPVKMRVTGYCACPKCCGSFSDGVTASNHRIHPGDAFVAADKTYAFGTQMIIPGYHASEPVTVQDRGRLIKGDRLDVFFHSHQEAKEWGVQYLDVLVKVD